MLDRQDPVRGAAIAAFRAARLMTQAALAEASQLHVSTVKKAEAGRPMSAETASALCAVLGVPQGAFVAPLWGRPCGGDASPPARAATAHLEPSLPIEPSPGRSVAVPLLAAAALAFEIAAWIPIEGNDPFRFWQAGAQAWLGLAIAWAGARAVRNATGKRARGRAGAIFLAGLCFFAWQPAHLYDDLALTAQDVGKILNTYARLNGIVHVRSVLDPSWDPAVARWSMITWMQTALDLEHAPGETPGRYAWREEHRLSCREAYLKSPSYDPIMCDPPAGRMSSERTLGNLWRSIVGGSFISKPEETMEGRDTPEEHIAEGAAYAEARALYDADHDGSHRKALAIAASRRDRKGPAG